MATANITIMGRLGRDVEMKTTPDGFAYAKFSVAVNFPALRGSDKERVNWYNVTAWGNQRDIVAKLVAGDENGPYLRKGREVVISGQLIHREYTDESGATRYSLDLRQNELTLTSGRLNPAAETPATTPAAAPSRPRPAAEPEDIDAIPF